MNINKNRILVGHKVVDENGATVSENNYITITHENGTFVTGERKPGETRREQKKRLFAEFVKKMNGED